MTFLLQKRMQAVSVAVVMAGMAAAPGARAASESVLYSFKGPPGDGSAPNGLLYRNGVLYGTTAVGGSGTCRYQPKNGCGTVFSLTLDGSERTLYNFAQTNSKDGAVPGPGLVEAGGALYGTTFLGGHSACTDMQDSYGCGTVFKITPGGGESILHSFDLDEKLSGAGGTILSARPDGSSPNGGLVKRGDDLFGTTQGGGEGRFCVTGSPECGTVFKVSLKSVENVIYSFGHGQDGDSPSTGLVQCNGAFYGATTFGGQYRYGTVYKMNPGGLPTVIYSFDGGSNGAFPDELICAGNKLFGSTFDDAGNSTVFKIDGGGRFKVLHTFQGSGATLGLIWYREALYGVTVSGGDGLNGTIFEITADGAFSQIYAFKGISSGDGKRRSA